MSRSVLVAVVALAACATAPAEDATPSEEELAELDDWATTADGKSDLPSTWAEVVAWLEDVYTNRMSAIWKRQEHPATATAAIARIRQELTRAGIADPTTRKFRTTVQRLRTDVLDHSEINIVLAPNKVARLVGDPKGAGVFFDGAKFEQAIGTPLCLTWSELTLAVEASYLPGAYGADFVCHTVTERVLRQLDVGTATFASQIRTYPAARYVWGPILPSGNSQTPSDWAVSRRCD